MHQKKSGLTKLSIIVVVAVLVVGIYFIYRWNKSRSPTGSSRTTTSQDQESALGPSGMQYVGTSQDQSQPAPSARVTTDQIKVLSPNGGEKWQIGTQYQIRWSHGNKFKTETYERTQVELVSALGTPLEFRKVLATYNSNISNAPTDLQWTTMDVPDRNDYRIRVSFQTSSLKNFGGAVFKGTSYDDVSDGAFSILSANNDPAGIVFINPNGGQKLKVGETVKISWTRNKLVLPVIITLEKGEKTVDTLGSSLGTYGSSFNWIVTLAGDPVTGSVQPGSDFKIRVSTPNLQGYMQFSDTSDATFTISK